jgi:hypothetical protein
MVKKMINLFIENMEAIFGTLAIIGTGAWNYYLWNNQRMGRSNVSIVTTHKIVAQTEELNIIEMTAILNNSGLAREYFSNIEITILGCQDLSLRYKKSEVLFDKEIIRNVRLFNKDWKWTWVNKESKNSYKILVPVGKENLAMKIICKAKYLNERDDHFIADTLYVVF